MYCTRDLQIVNVKRQYRKMGVTINLVSVSLPNGGAFCCKVHQMKHCQGLHYFTTKSASYSNKGGERWNIVSLARSNWEQFYSPLGVMLVLCKATLSMLLGSSKCVELSQRNNDTKLLVSRNAEIIPAVQRRLPL